MPLFSIIVPVYNQEKYIEECLRSIIGQTCHDLEIILVNDGSTDNSLHICRKYADADDRVVVVNKSNGGLISARKAGIAKASGKYIGFVDSDDIIERSMYEEAAAIIEKTDADVIVEGNTFLYADYKKERYELIPTGFYDKAMLMKKVYPNMLCNPQKMERGVAPAIWAKIVKKTIIEKIIENLDEKINDGEDAAISYPCLLMAQSAYFASDDTHYQYRILENSMSHKYNENWMISASHYCEWMQKKFEEYGNSDLLEALKYEKFYMFYRYYNREIRACREQSKSMKKVFESLLDDTVIGKTIYEIDIKNISIPFLERMKLVMIKGRKWNMLTCLACLEGIYQKVKNKKRARG